MRRVRRCSTVPASVLLVAARHVVARRAPRAQQCSKPWDSLLLGFAVLQAWPGRGFWQGMLHGRPGSLAAAVGGMAAMRQPAVLSEFVGSFGSLVARHGYAVNLGAVIAMAAVGGCLLTGRAAIAAPAAAVAVVLCLADWVSIQDLGFLGGLGTDPNSMLPQALILSGGLMAMVAAPAAASPPDYVISHRQGGPVFAGPVPSRASRSAGLAFGTASTSTVLTLWAAAMVLLGAVPIALAMLRSA